MNEQGGRQSFSKDYTLMCFLEIDKGGLIFQVIIGQALWTEDFSFSLPSS